LTELSPEERQRIYAEEKARMEARQQIKTERRRRAATRNLLAVVLLCSLPFILAILIAIGPNELSQTPSSSARKLTGNISNDKLTGLSDPARAIAIGEMTGRGCIGTTSFFYAMNHANDAIWFVRCSDHTRYALEISPDPDGTSRVVECDLLYDSCVEKFMGR
jgi:hypothetical protein